MKKQLINSIEKKALTFSVALMLVFGNYAKSFEVKADSAAKTKSSFISYKGLRNDHLVFEVDYKNELSEPFELIIKNDQNDILYKKAFDAKPLNTDVLLTEVPDGIKLTFSIHTRKNNLNQSFEIDTRIKTTEEYVVKGI